MLRVTCAIIIHNEKILLCQRGENMRLPLKWEFPGGKLEKDEAEEACIIREIKEELHLHIHVGQQLTPVEYTYETFAICLIPFLATVTNPTLQLTEHKAYAWVSPQSLLQYDLAPADIPIVHEILQLWNLEYTKP
ncbi:(deoxy)nucleoside triphosphate pyrophosphohydrolase [Sphingobacterium sp. Mn56C]|uniref:(deoxy)nucleoside triphosphate pyrophosphohydrolase n=1 Tax=Sphingobacterium sp. Mn56C TaxID=3395261 RepID=UPI003BC187FD